MSTSRMIVFAAMAAMLIVPLAALQSQNTTPEIGAAALQNLVRNGPNGSAELELIVDAHVDAGRSAEAADAIARFILGEYGTQDDHGCEFCIDVFSSEATPRQHEHFSVVTAAFDLVEQRAQETGSGDLLLDAAQRNIVSSGNARAMNRATYYIMRATQIGIDPERSLSVVSFLWRQGNFSAARNLAAHLHDHEASPHYHSQQAQQWISLLDTELGRRESLAQVIFDSLGMNPSVSENDYLPVVKAPPSYPSDAAAQRVEGSVVVEFTVDTTGKTADVSVVSSTNSLFNESALAAARQFRYAPRVVAGTPVEVAGVRNKITYRLDP